MPLDKKLLQDLVDIFQSELSEQSQVIINALVKIEHTDNIDERKKLIETIHRSAHNLKGSSRGLGINAVGEIAHKMESIFSIYMKGNDKPSKEVINACVDAIDKMKTAMKCFIHDKELTFNLKDYLQSLDNPTQYNHSTPTNTAERKQDDDIDIDYIKIPVTELNRMHAIIENIQSISLSIQDSVRIVNQLPFQFETIDQIRKNLLKDCNDIDSDTLYKYNNDYMNFHHSLLNAQRDNRHHATEIMNSSNQLQSQMANLRLVPASYLLYSLPRYVRDLCQQLDKKVNLLISGDDVRLDKLVLDELRDPINHLLRNAIDHGIEPGPQRLSTGKPLEGTISISFNDLGHGIEILLSDDGGGVNLDAIKKQAIAKKLIPESEIATFTEESMLNILFMPGFTTAKNVTDISGRGVGLDVVNDNIKRVHGSIETINKPGSGLTFKIYVPMNLSSERGLLIRCGDECYVIPTRSISHILMLNDNDIFGVSERKAVKVEEKTIYLYPLSQILAIGTEVHKKDKYYVIVLDNHQSSIALLVDDVISENEIIIKPFQHPLTKIDYVSGATLIDANQLALILNVDDLISSSKNVRYEISSDTEADLPPEQDDADARKRILVVDDSITTRTLEKNILESHNFHVTTAVDGRQAWDILQSDKFSLIITDVSMPNMDGFELTEHIKTNDNTKATPVIIVSSLNSDTDKARGVAVGADAYIVKNEFESGELIDIIEQLL